MSVFVKVWSEEPLHCLGTSSKMKIAGPLPDLQDQALWGRPLNGHFKPAFQVILKDPEAWNSSGPLDVAVRVT